MVPRWSTASKNGHEFLCALYAEMALLLGQCALVRLL